jgi:phage terminase small subunit
MTDKPKKVRNQLTEAQAREKRILFAHIYAADPTRNGAKAAREAGFPSLTKDSKRLNRVACNLLRRPEVKEIIEKEMNERAARLRINADWLLMRMAAEVEADIADLYNPDGSIKPVHEWPPVWRQGLVAGFEVEELFQGKGDDRVPIGRLRKVKLTDRTRIKELIGRHINVGAFKDKVEHSVDDNLASLIARSMDIKD